MEETQFTESLSVSVDALTGRQAHPPQSFGRSMKRPLHEFEKRRLRRTFLSKQGKAVKWAPPEPIATVSVSIAKDIDAFEATVAPMSGSPQECKVSDALRRCLCFGAAIAQKLSRNDGYNNILPSEISAALKKAVAPAFNGALFAVDATGGGSPRKMRTA